MVRVRGGLDSCCCEGGSGGGGSGGENETVVYRVRGDGEGGQRPILRRRRGAVFIFGTGMGVMMIYSDISSLLCPRPF